MPYRRKGPSTQTFAPSTLTEVWDGADWTPITAITATRRRETDPDHRLLGVETRAGVVDVTAHHHMLDADHDQVTAREVEAGDRLALWERRPVHRGQRPRDARLDERDAARWRSCSGCMAADGHVAADGHCLQFTNNDEALQIRVAELWSRLLPGLLTQLERRIGIRPVPPPSGNSH